LAHPSISGHGRGPEKIPPLHGQVIAATRRASISGSISVAWCAGGGDSGGPRSAELDEATRGGGTIVRVCEGEGGGRGAAAQAVSTAAKSANGAWQDLRMTF
jgi:hypothetical protein